MTTTWLESSCTNADSICFYKLTLLLRASWPTCNYYHYFILLYYNINTSTSFYEYLSILKIQLIMAYSNYMTWYFVVDDMKYKRPNFEAVFPHWSDITIIIWSRSHLICLLNNRMSISNRIFRSKRSRKGQSNCECRITDKKYQTTYSHWY